MKEYIINHEEKTRLNILKFISIIFVLFIHSYSKGVNFASEINNFNLPYWIIQIEEIISQMISRCGVPIFFLISAILLFKKERNYKDTLKNKFKTLFIPYIFWNAFWICIFIVLQNLPLFSDFFSGSHTLILERSFVEWLALFGIGTQYPCYPQDYPLWFIRDLMIVTLFFPIIKKFTNKYPKFSLILGIFLVFLNIDYFFITCFQYFIIGGSLVALDIHVQNVDNIPLNLLTLLYTIALLLRINFDINFLHPLFILISIVFLIRITKQIHENIKLRNIFIHLSKYTFFIYAFHEMTLSSLKKVCFKIFPTQPLIILLEYLLIPFIVILICIIIYEILNRFFPNFMKIITGNR